MRLVAVLFKLALPLALSLALAGGCGEQPSPTTPAPLSPTAAPQMTSPAPPPATVTAVPRPTTPPPPKPTPKPTPKPAAFQVVSVEVSPAEVMSGKQVAVSVEIRNTGETDGTYTARLTLDGKELTTREVRVAAGATQKLDFSPSLEPAGAHTLEVGGVTGSVRVLKDAQFQAASLRITPALVFPGQEVTVEAEVTNAGDVKGALPAVLNVNGVDVDSRVMTLDPGVTDRVSFTMARDAAGSYAIKVGGKTSDLTVTDVKTYTSPRFGHSFDYPGDWTLTEANPQVTRATRPGLALIVALDIVDTGTAPLDFARQVGAQVVQSTGGRLNAEKEVRRDGAVHGYQQDISFASSDGTPVTSTQLVVKRGRYGFTVIAQARDDLWTASKPVFDAFIASFKPPAVATGAYTDSTRGYTLTLPAGWDGIETGAAPTLLRFNSPPARTTGVTGFVQTSPLGRDTTARDYATAVLEAIRQQTTSFKIASQKDITLGGGLQAYESVYSFVQDGATVQGRQVAMVRGSGAWELVLMAREADFAANQSAMDQMVRSFAFVEPRPFGVSRQESWFVHAGEIVTLDPALTEEGSDGIIGAIFSGLVKTGPDLKITGDLAARWEASPDGKTYTFHIRDGARFQSGRPVTAADVKYSWERASAPATRSRKAATYLGDIAGAADVLSGKATEMTGVKVIDDRTLQVSIDGPKPYFLGKLAQPAAFIVDRANVARGMNWTRTPNGTGPFKVKQWKKDELLILERNENYYQPVLLKNVVFRLFAGYSVMMYERGEIDMANVSLYDLDRVLDRANPLNKELLSGKQVSSTYVGFNVTKPPFDDPAVRKAFALALDTNKILEVSLKGNGERAAGYLPPGIPGHNPELKPLPFDPAQAKQLLAGSKYAGRLPPVTLYVYAGAWPHHEAMIAMWKQNLGVDVRVQVVEELKEYYERSHNREFQLFESGWRADYLDPQNFLEVLFQSRSSENQFAYSNPAVDAALKEAAVEPDAARRLQRYRDIEKMALNDLPAVPFYQAQNEYVLSKPYVKGLKVYPISVNHWKDLSISLH